MVTELWRVCDVWKKISNGHNLETKERGAIILVHDMSSRPTAVFYGE